MLSPPPMAVFVALLLIAFFQLRIFRLQVCSVAHRDQSIARTSSVTSPYAGSRGAFTIDPLLPDVYRPKIRQISMRAYNATNEKNDALDERCLATHVEYGEKWGYPTHILREDVRGKGLWRELLFSKPLYVLSLTIAEMAKPVDERAEWLVFFDSDTILLNPNIPWSLFLPPSDFSHIHFLGGRDWGEGSGFNSGVFFVRINEWSVKMLTEVSALPDLRKDVEIDFNAEQTAFKWVFKRAGYREHVLYQPCQWFNGFEESFGHLPPVQDGDMLIHFGGLKTHKFGAVQRWLDRLERAPHELQIPVENTNYQAEIDAYWAALRDARDMVQTAEHFSDDDRMKHDYQTKQAYRRKQDFFHALEKLRQIIYDEADKTSLVLDIINQVKSGIAAVQNLADGTKTMVAEVEGNTKTPGGSVAAEEDLSRHPGTWTGSREGRKQLLG